MQSIDSLRELNAKLLAEITELGKENAELREKILRFAEIDAENARLRQIIEENARRDAENAELANVSFLIESTPFFDCRSLLYKKLYPF